MMKRAGLAVMVVLLLIGSTSCATQQAEDATPTPDDATSEPRDEKRTQGFFPDEPQLAIDWQNTVVDVVPTSRFQDPPGGNDTANVETVIALEEEPDNDTKEFFKELDVETEFDGNLVRMRYTFDVEPNEDDQYSFEIQAPVEFAEMSKNDDVSVVVLLPRDASSYENVPTYEVELEGFTDDTEEDDLEVVQADDAPGRRITIGMYKRTDPGIGPIWNYLPLL